MKTDRLFALTLYLLNHGRVSASELAERFDVSVRTIQRDVDTLSFSGIPIISHMGTDGGYELDPAFRIERQFAKEEEYAYLLTAMRGLVTATDDNIAKNTFDKIELLSKKDNYFDLDFSVLHEGDRERIQTLRRAITEKLKVAFTYTNNNRETHRRTVEPIILVYRWYAWYLVAYSLIKRDYRLYKLVRMDDVELLDEPFSVGHPSADEILSELDRKTKYEDTLVTADCSRAIWGRVKEYLKARIVEEHDDRLRVEFTVIESEQLWLSTIISLGEELRVLSPSHIIERITDVARKILDIYDI